MLQHLFSKRVFKACSLGHSYEYRPRFFQLENEADKYLLEILLKSDPEIVIHDEILGQVEELIKCRNPKKTFLKDELSALGLEYISKYTWDEFGMWVYFPWSKKLIHVLKEDEFIEVRTNRNRYKITPEEYCTLQSKKIGIIGLSVGQSIALTIAMERICCEIRLADFDILELSNMNRIRTGLHNLNIPKAILVAREIAEIDPFINIKVYSEGLTEDNVDDFYSKDGKLDVCIEVCDGLSTKIFARHKAKEFKVPIVMNSSDRGTTDIERYDLYSDEPILHGLINHLNIELIKGAKTNEEKVPFLLPMLGIETSSDRLKSSMLEIQETITTWPQLASGVVLGGGICTDVCRRILLNQLKKSGRYFVDLEELISDRDRKIESDTPIKLNDSITKEEMIKVLTKLGKKGDINENQVELSTEIITKIVEAGTKAPSGANCQSWKWLYHSKTLYLFFDDVFRPDLLDCQRTTMITGLGAATENVVLKAHELGLEVIVEQEDLSQYSKLIASFRFFESISNEVSEKFEGHSFDYLSSVIDKRESNRTIDFYQEESIENYRLEKLKEIVKTIPGADLHIISDRRKLEKLAEITARMDRIRYLSKGGHNDFRAEVRWTPEEAEATKTGISFQETMDLTPTEFAGFYVSKNWPVVKNLNDWGLGYGFGKIQRKWILSSSAVGLITMPQFSVNDFFLGGRALERIWLAATYDKMNSHPPSLSTLIFNTFQYGKKDDIPENYRLEIGELMSEFENIFNIDSKAAKILLLRFFIGETSKYKSHRKPLNEILLFS